MNLDEHIAANKAALEKRDTNYWKRLATDTLLTNNDLILTNKRLADRVKELEALVVHYNDGNEAQQALLEHGK
jgi:hypothetical protein